MQRAFLSLFLILIASACVFGFGLSCDLDVRSDGITFSPNQSANIEVSLRNTGEYVISDGEVVIQLVRGNLSFPHAADENVMVEKSTDGIFLRQGELKTLNISIQIPSSAPAGEYRFDAYFRTPRTSVLGVPFIFNAERFASIYVSGNTTDRVFILRNESTLEGTIGQAGPIILGEVVWGNLTVMNLGSEKELNLLVFVDVWDDSFKQSPNYNISFSMVNGSRKIEYGLHAPEKPSAYSVRFEIRNNETGELYSLWRSRFINSGPSARIAELASNSTKLEIGKKVQLNYVVIGHADKSKMNGTAEILVESAGREVFARSDEIILNEINVIVEKQIEFESNASAGSYTATLIVSEQNETLDSYVLTINSDDFGEFFDPCTGIACEDKCESAMRYFDGRCEFGECVYEREVCDFGCNESACLQQTIIETPSGWQVDSNQVLIVVAVLALIGAIIIYLRGRMRK